MKKTLLLPTIIFTFVMVLLSTGQVMAEALTAGSCWEINNGLYVKVDCSISFLDNGNTNLLAPRADRGECAVRTAPTPSAIRVGPCSSFGDFTFCDGNKNTATLPSTNACGNNQQTIEGKCFEFTSYTGEYQEIPCTRSFLNGSRAPGREECAVKDLSNPDSAAIVVACSNLGLTKCPTNNLYVRDLNDCASAREGYNRNAARSRVIDCDGRTPAGLQECLRDRNPIMLWIERGINFFAAGAGVAITIMIIIGGMQYASAGANPQAVMAAKKKISSALIALVAFAFLYSLLQWIVPGGVF